MAFPRISKKYKLVYNQYFERDYTTNMRKDFAGQRFGRLVVVRRATSSTNGVYRWECVCDCGGTKEVLVSNLKNGNTRSCGCLAANKGPQKDLAGTRFGRLVAVKSVKSDGKDRWWE